ncbi:hypothetical protein NIES4071_43600 [Calothrix sp. NIES-4071]|nr:hypothetical protein NIES4071_43600 [Calothrix sp. NIES-4071]BAZ58674.1 hypothetical protein NIES4105_43530 [Calothrix sp. NIES-4105]
MRQNNDKYLSFLEKIRWEAQPQCPYCESNNATPYKNERRYHCNSCYTSYSVTVGTLFHKTHISMEKWQLAIRIIHNSPEGISVRQLAKELGINKNSASYMMERIRKATSEEQKLLQKFANFQLQEDI